MSANRLTLEVWPVSSEGQPGNNEDTVMLFQPADPNRQRRDGALYLVADGEGGAARGKLASEYAARRVMHRYFSSDEPDLGLRLREAIEAANAELYAYARSRPELVKLSTTITAAVVRGEQVTIASVGDSRAYLVRDGAISQITRDHTLVQQLLDEAAISAEEVRSHPRRDVVLRSLGAEEMVRVDLYDLRLRPDDTLLLCTDGLTEILLDDEIGQIVGSSLPRRATETLVQKVLDRGGKDNITVLAALVRGPGAPSVSSEPAPHQWDGLPPIWEEGARLSVRPPQDPGATMVAQRPLIPEPPVDPMAATTQGRRLDQLPEVQEALRGQQPYSDPGGWLSAPDDTQFAQPTQPATPSQPAPQFQPEVQPAPPYPPAPPQGYPPVPAQPGYPPQGTPPQGYPPVAAQPGYPPGSTPPYGTPAPTLPPQPPRQPQFGPAQPRGYTPPPGYEFDPVTGLPPMPLSGPAQPGGYPQQAAYSTGRFPAAQMPAQRRGVPLGLFAVVALLSVLVTAALVFVIINPFGWDLPQIAALGGQPDVTETPSGPVTPTVDPLSLLPTAAPSEAAVEVSPTPLPVAAPTGMVLVEAGAFIRGATQTEIDAAVLRCIDEADDNVLCNPQFFTDAQPSEEITLGGFFIDITEVTNQAYAQCVAAGICTPPGNTIFYNDAAFALHPVVYVNWSQARAYCEWQGKRLPTEAEWEKAARWDPVSQTAFLFPWGNTYEPGRANTLIAGLGGTAAVQTFQGDLSPWGIYDMAGNVWEWTQDWYQNGYAGLGTVNPTGPVSAPYAEALRTARGGSWQDLESRSRAAYRHDTNETTQQPYIGFRCAQGLDAPAVTPAAAPSATPDAALNATPEVPTPTNSPAP